MEIGTTIEFSTILAIAGAITAVGGAWLTVRKISKDYEKQGELEAAKILQTAKEEASKVKALLVSDRALMLQSIEIKIENVQANLDTHKSSVAKDLSHIRETYNGEIRNLGIKIEDLRAELRNQHSQLVALLTKMISKD